MPLDPQARKILDLRAQTGLPETHTLSPAQSRTNSRLLPAPIGPDVAMVKDILVPGEAGNLTARVYTPNGNGPFPILVWFHGGGWVLGDLDRADGTARELALRSESLVISVDYRLSPETKFPGPIEDCYIATQWVASNASMLNGDPAKIAVGGDSAGGNLATVVAMMSRDRGGANLVFQLLVYPVTDYDFTTHSYSKYSNGYLLTKESMIWFWDHYLNDPDDGLNPYASPLKTDDLSGLPPALLITAEYDPLCDEGESYAKRLKASGINCKYLCYGGMIHGFFSMSNDIDKGKDALKTATDALTLAFKN